MEGVVNMAKVFNVTAVCIPQKHYMVDPHRRLKEIKKLVDEGNYFMINRARQYGKTTTLLALEQFLQKEYYVVFLDFQMISSAKFQNENAFSLVFAKEFLRSLKRGMGGVEESLQKVIENLEHHTVEKSPRYELSELFDDVREICAASDKPIVLIIDEVDSAEENQVFLDFLALLRADYIRRTIQPTFQSVILAGVYDVRNLRRKLRPDEEQKVNSPWNVAASFKTEMSFSREEIEKMLLEYESDYQTGMNIHEMASLLYDYTSGYPFLVSRLCKLLDEEVSIEESFGTKKEAWTKAGFREAVRLILMEKNTLFESLSEKLIRYPELNVMLQGLLFAGRSIVYNAFEPATNVATLFGFVKNQNGRLAVANRIFDTWLYNFYLSGAAVQKLDIYKASLQDKNQFVVDGHLDMRLILEKFVVHFHELYGERKQDFLEEEGRKYFLLYLRPIINGTGNYYIEARTRELRRTDVIVDYRGEQYIIEMKIWHGEEYNRRGEEQLLEYLEDYHQNRGYMLSFNFNQKKRIGVQEIVLGEKILIEAVV